MRDTSINIFETMPDCNLQIQKVVRVGLRAGVEADAGAPAPMPSTPPALPAIAASLARAGHSRAKWPTFPQKRHSSLACANSLLRPKHVFPEMSLLAYEPPRVDSMPKFNMYFF